MERKRATDEPNTNLSGGERRMAQAETFETTDQMVDEKLNRSLEEIGHHFDRIACMWNTVAGYFACAGETETTEIKTVDR